MAGRRAVQCAMCKECVRKPFPERGNTCLDGGHYFLNFAACACGAGGLCLTAAARKVAEDDDGEETTTYQHVCKECGHVVCEHFHSFSVVDGAQEYLMECMLCGKAADTRYVDPQDPRAMHSGAGSA